MTDLDDLDRLHASTDAFGFVDFQNAMRPKWPALSRELRALRRLREVVEGGFGMKTHDLATDESWIVDEIDEVRAALQAAKEAADAARSSTG